MRSVRGRRRGVRRIVVVVPSIFTLANLFFGIWSIVLASQGEFYRASWYIVISGVLDMLDGLLARMSNTGSRFGGELDSLVDIVSFGVAPSFLIYFLLLESLGAFAWVFSYGFVVCVALRLARFNVRSLDSPHSRFSGLPSPAAGMTLATYYPFSQTDFYGSQLATLPWSQILIFLTIALSIAMVSTVRYAKLPRMGFRTPRGLIGLGTNLTILGFGIWRRDIFFFPLGITYLSYGLARAAVVAIAERDDDGLGEDSEESEIVHDIRAPRARWEPPGRGN